MRAGPPTRVLIAGGSLGGLFAGVLLHEAGFDVHIAERSRRGLSGRGAGLVGQRDIFAVLRAIGCEHVAAIGVEARERITLGRDGAILDRQAAPQLQLSWDRIFEAFRARMPEDRYRAGRRVTGLREVDAAIEVAFDEGASERFDLAIGADGLGSVVRDAIVDVVRPRYAGYVAYRGLFPEADLPASAAQVLAGRFAFYRMPGSHILGYLVAAAGGAVETGQRRYNWVWYRPEPALRAALTDADGRVHGFSLPPGALSAARRARLRDDADALLPPSFAAAVQAEPAPFVQAIFDLRTPAMARGRIALLGDAAFTVRPHTAMGVAKAAGDALALRLHLAAGDDPAAALRAYAEEREPIGRQIADYGLRLGASLGS